MFFRFAAGLFLAVLVSMASVRLEKQTLEMRRAVSVQYYQTDLLLELLVRLRLDTQRLTAPAQLAATIEDAATSQNSRQNRENTQSPQKRPPKSRIAREEKPSRTASESRLPLMRFQHPFNPEGID